MTLWLFAALLNSAASLTHIAIIVGGPNWYRFFGAGEAMATMAEHKHPWPAVMTSGIAVALMIAAAYCLALGEYIRPLPFMTLIGLFITGVYTLRGLLPLLAMGFVPSLRTSFIIWSSLICAGVALIHGLAWL
ncbi:hypothetical protein [Saccharospirillum impatiens]|uniref:hypothetical protein n=1 Tax=Saccharospirillum impatiens TaxID=169438 RepID=UPI0004025316|nr:hypothetical protein [Saccharospirillum impatiens]